MGPLEQILIGYFIIFTVLIWAFGDLKEIRIPMILIGIVPVINYLVAFIGLMIIVDKIGSKKTCSFWHQYKKENNKYVCTRCNHVSKFD